MKLKFLAISDTHLGEETSLLCFPHGRRQLWKSLREVLGAGDGRVSVDELILVGDIPDRTLSSTSQIITQTNAFMQTLGSALSVRRAVYVPGNHDHTLWSDYQAARHGAPVGTTSVSGESIVIEGEVVKDALPAAEPLLSLFFGWPEGSQWRGIQDEKRLDFVISNPIYAAAHAGRTYVFAHGTHFRKDVTMPRWLKELLDHAEVDEILGGIEIDPGGNVGAAGDLADLERVVAPFVDTLWPSSRGNPTSTSDQLWYLLSYVSGKFGHKRAVPPGNAILGRAELAALPDDARIKRLTPEYDFAAPSVVPLERYQNGSIDRCRRYFLGRALAQARVEGLPVDQVTFVYGDTHEGGFGRLPGPTEGADVRVYNTGAWVVHNAAQHPPCHLFAVDEAGDEYLIDLTFGGVRVDGSSLLEVAAEDAENRKRATSRLLRALLAALPTPH
jgi:hypothetical protein